jgi:hypothetical protein
MTRMRASVALFLTILVATTVGIAIASGAARDDNALVESLLLEQSDLPAVFKDAGPTPPPKCFSLNSGGLTAQATSHEFDRLAARTQTTMESRSALYRSPSAATAVFKRLFGSKTKTECVLAGFKGTLKATQTVTHLHYLPVHLSVGALRLWAWEVTFDLNDKPNRSTPIQIAISGYLVHRAVTVFLDVIVGLDPNTTAYAKRASEALTIKLRDAKL